MKPLKNKIFLLLLFVFLPLFLFIAKDRLFAQTCGSVDDCNTLIGEYQSEIGRLQSQANTLSNQIAQFNAQIGLTSLKIKQTEEKIELLGGRISQLEVSLDDLTKAFSSRVVETYKLARGGKTIFFLLTSGNLNEVVSRFHYLQLVQKEDANFLNRLQTAQVNYKNQKTDQEELQDELAKEKANLNSQKAARASLLTATKNDEVKYQSLLSSAKAQFFAFSNYANRQGGASILSNQTKCDDDWRCYYNQRDSQWGNMTLGGTNYLMKDSGCFITSVAMLANHFGRNILPKDIALLSAAVTSGGDLRWSFNVNGINVSISSASYGELDQRLNNGPVIAGLYLYSNSYPDHFIVILRKEGDSYIMHDPFMENGNNKKLTDKYSVSDIKTLRLVQFN